MDGWMVGRTDRWMDDGWINCQLTLELGVRNRVRGFWLEFLGGDGIFHGATEEETLGKDARAHVAIEIVGGRNK